ncbi:MAG: TRAP transporter small permease [Lachnospiraceae bacterium]|nr:TRAP transporter small permease [Lachnospiraceae bacterium]
MKLLEKVLDGLEWLCKTLAVLLLCTFVCLTLLQVISRYLMESPLTWTEQVSRYLHIWMLMLYAPVIIRHSGNMAFDMLLKRLPPKVIELTTLLCEVLILAFSLFWCRQSLALCQEFAGRRLIGINLPYAAVYAAQPVGAAVMAVFSAEVIVKRLAGFGRRRQKEGEV